MLRVIGLYGGAGSGKSEVVSYLKTKYKAYIIKADDIGHRLYKKNRPGYKAIVRICGKAVLDSSKNIDYHKLSELLFNNPSILHKVNSSIHPMVYAKTRELIDAYKIRKRNGLVVFESALIPDKDLDFITEAWYVYSEMLSKADRMMRTRNYSKSKIESVVCNQPTEDQYREYCDYVINNDGTIEELKKTIDNKLNQNSAGGERKYEN